MQVLNDEDKQHFFQESLKCKGQLLIIIYICECICTPIFPIYSKLATVSGKVKNHGCYIATALLLEELLLMKENNNH